MSALTAKQVQCLENIKVIVERSFYGDMDNSHMGNCFKEFNLLHGTVSVIEGLPYEGLNLNDIDNMEFIAWYYRKTGNTVALKILNNNNLPVPSVESGFVNSYLTGQWL